MFKTYQMDGLWSSPECNSNASARQNLGPSIEFKYGAITDLVLSK